MKDKFTNMIASWTYYSCTSKLSIVLAK